MGDNSWETFQGLNRLLESSKWSISKCCRAVDSCLEANRDNLRGFFEQCFLVLLRQVYGFDGQGWLWLASQSGRESDITALLDLLSPTGLLMRDMFVADADQLMKYIFPLERLPTHTQMLMSFDGGRGELSRWPQYRNGAVAEVKDAAGKGTGRWFLQVYVFNLFMMWTAFYALRGAGGGVQQLRNNKSLHLAPHGITNSVRKAVDSFGHFGRSTTSDVGGQPYLRLLRSYLHYFLPQPVTASMLQPASKRGSAPLSGAAAAASPAASPDRTRGEVLLNVLLEFWLCDGDQPLPPASSAAVQPGVVADMGVMRTVSYEPPSQELLDALCVFVRHISVIERPKEKQLLPAQGYASWLPTPQVLIRLPQHQGRSVPVAGPAKLGAAAAVPHQSIMLHLYRFLRRALSLWPDNRGLTPIVNVWMLILAPWRQSAAMAQLATVAGQAVTQGTGQPRGLREQLSHMSDLLHLIHRDDTTAAGGINALAGEYSAEWQTHVLSHLPFYFLLLPLFIDRTLDRVMLQDEAAMKDFKQVLDVFVDNPALLSVLHHVEGDYMAYLSATPRRPQGQFAELLPWVQEQSHDFEVAATANCYGDTPVTQAMPYFLLFSIGPSGVGFRVRDVLQQARRTFKPEVVDPVWAAAQKVFPMDRLAECASSPRDNSSNGLAREHAPGIRRSAYSEVRYKGDPMMKPITSTEVAWLVRLLVEVGRWLNHVTGLDQPYLSDEEPAAQNVLQAMSVYLRSRHLRINLRPMADMRTLVFGPLLAAIVYWMYSVVYLILTVIFELLTTDYSEFT